MLHVIALIDFIHGIYVVERKDINYEERQYF
jgi:hypothetical protein